MSSRIIRAPEGAVLEPFRWDAVANPLARPSTPIHPSSRHQSSDNAEQERVIEARVKSERDQAFRQGEAAGRQAALQHLEAELLRLARAIEDVAGYKSRLRAQAESEVLQLALAVSRRILRREVQTDPDAILGLVKAVLEKVSLREVTEVRVAPTHQPSLATHFARIGAPEAVQLIADPSLEPGALLVKTSSGLTDASVQTQLEEISRGFADAFGYPQ